jgi:predicted secreted protein
MAGRIRQKSGMMMISTILLMILITTGGCVGFGDERFKDMPAPTECQKTMDLKGNVTINETHNNATICTNAEGAFTLQLNENSRTGYQWQLTASNGLQVIDEGVSWYDETGLPTRMPGIKGIHEWKIFVKESGVQKIKAILQRPERVTGNEQVFWLNVIVK